MYACAHYILAFRVEWMEGGGGKMDRWMLICVYVCMCACMHACMYAYSMHAYMYVGI